MAEEEFLKAAQYNIEEQLYSERILFLKLNYENKESEDMKKLFMAREWDVYPNIFYTHFHNGELLKYKYTKSEITFENILSFI